MTFLFEVAEWGKGRLGFIDVEADDIIEACAEADKLGYAEHGPHVMIMRVFSEGQTESFLVS